MGTDGNVVVEGNIMFKVGENSGTTYYTGKELPLYTGETKWYVDSQGLLSVNINGTQYGEGDQEGEKIAESENPMIRYYAFMTSLDFHNIKYTSKITKIKFDLRDKVLNNVV